MATGARKKVVILGGGIAGMSAAHELVERGFDVEVFEQKAIPGGKARSIDASAATGLVPFRRRMQPATLERRPLPGEHGFRFFPGFYKHVVDTMERIPCNGGSVAQNLVDTSELAMASFDRPSYMLPAEFPRNAEDLRVWTFAAIAALSGRIGVAADDYLFFATKLWEFLTCCEERRLVELERINWWDFIEAGSRSEMYQKYFGNGITRSLVAAKARRASTRTIGNIFLQIVFDVASPGVAADRVLNGPTNDVWIDPWLEYLRARGVVYHFNARVKSIEYSGGRVRSAAVDIAGNTRRVSADYFVGALPVERMADLLLHSPGMLQGDPSLANLRELTEYVEWMNGIQYYLTEDVPIAKGHAIFVDSPWALTAVSQPQFWKNVDLTEYGDGQVRGLLSVDISDWDVKGLNGKAAEHCTREEIALETWEQLKRSLNVGGELLRDDQLHSWFLDPGISDVDADNDPSTPLMLTNAEPLLVNYVDTWRIRPEALTRIPNFFLASDYVRTFTDLATMEAANEAARRAVNGIVHAARSDTELCRLWNLHEPEAFALFRAHDRVRFRKGLPWDGRAVGFVRSALDFSGQTGSPEPPPPGNVEQVAAGARSSSDEGLRRLRILP
jgi:uncharacterized protein with NAD-binding domain and iron-sulfur cluster